MEKAEMGSDKKRPCNPPEICKFLEELNAYLIAFQADYTKVRIAVCNVEAKAFDNLGTQAKRLSCTSIVFAIHE